MADDNVAVGVFLGLDSSSLEYIASIIAPYQQRFTPRVGDFMLIDNGAEYIVARVMDYIPQGELTSFMGEKWLSEVALSPEAIGQDLKRKKVFYRVKIKLLGRIEKASGNFTPGLSQIPHITSPVLFPSSDFIQAILNQALQDQANGIEIGSYWLDPAIPVHFDVGLLAGKRTFIFARAGYGKSNLMKVLAAHWKAESGALMIFDPEGEYAVTDKKDRPGIMDNAPAILVTNRKAVKETLSSTNVYDKLKFNLKAFTPTFIIPIIVNEEKHETVFFSKLMSLREHQWHELVDLLYTEGWNTTSWDINAILKEKKGNNVEEDFAPRKEDVSVQAIVNNLVGPIRKLHDPDSQLLKVLEEAARAGLPVIMDISLIDTRSALQFSSIVVAHFFNQNQQRFTGGGEDLFKVVFVVEEAQSVIGGQNNVGKFVELAKEGRKYGLGGIFITQQPGSIAPEILSQGDNFFVFHLLSKGDLTALARANANYSEDVLTQLLNEPIPGKAYMWTARQPFVVPVNVANFEEQVMPNQAPTVQANARVLDQILQMVADAAQVQASIVAKLREIAAQYNITPEDDGRLADYHGPKKDISKTLFRSLDVTEREFLESEGAIQVYDDKPFAINFRYLDQLWDLVKKESQNA